MALNDDEGSNDDPDESVNADTPPYIDSPANGARVGSGQLEVVGGGHGGRYVRIASLDQEDDLSDSVQMGDTGRFILRFREAMNIGSRSFQVILWPPFPALRSRPWTVYHVPPVKIDSPSNNAWISSDIVRIAGRGAARLGEARVYLGPSTQERRIGTGTVDEDGNWTVDANLATYEAPLGKLTLFVDYARGDFSFISSDRAFLTLNYLSPPTITAPGNGGATKERRPEIAGRGQAGALVSVLEENADVGYGQFTVSAGGHWSGRLERDLPDRPVKLVSVQSIGSADSAESDPIQFTFVSAPVITCPPANESVFLPLFVKGSGGRDKARIEIFKDLSSGPVLEYALSSSNFWTVTIFDLDPGPVSLVAEQVLNGVRSDRSAACGYKVMPPRLVAVTVEHPTSTTAKFSGEGHSGATVQITVVSGPAATPPSPVVVSGGKWQTTSVKWPFGVYELSAVQKVSDNAGGWIESWVYPFTVSHIFPVPSAITHTKVYTPVFSGKGVSGATIKLFAADGLTPVAPDARVINDQWSATASVQWGPVFEREIRLQQILGDQATDLLTYKVTIPPLTPVLNEPIDDGLSPRLSGTCWPGAGVTLEYNNDGKKHHPIVTNDRWTFRRPEAFESGVTHTFSVFQTVAPQSSAAATGSFTVRKPMLKPEITVPSEGAEVGRNPLVSGTNGMSGATMTVRDAQMGGELNRKLLLSDGDWSIELNNLEYRGYSLDAMQILDGIDSPASEPRNCQVVLEPPIICVPAEGGDLPRRSTLSGTGWPSARVTVWLEGQDQRLLLNVQVDGEGKWSGQVLLDQVGQHGLRAQQTLDGQVSRFAQRACRVVPSAPFIESPVRGAAIGSAVVISGFGYPGDMVTVSLASGAALGASQVLEEGTWSLSAHIEHPGGPGALIVVASQNEYDSAPSDPHPLQINTWLPTIKEPSAGRWVGQPVVFAGLGKDGLGQVVSWFNPDVVWAADLPVIDGQWRGEASQSPPPGGNWCRFRQSITADTNPLSGSDWAESERFEVRPPPLSEDGSSR